MIQKVHTLFAALFLAAALVGAAPSALAQSAPPYDVAQLDPATRSAVDDARAAQRAAIGAGARARGASAGTIDFTGTGGDRYMGEGYGRDAEAQRNGHGLQTWDDGEFYAGQFRGGSQNGGNKDGFGVYSFVDGRMYEGQWSADRRHGYGVQWDPQGAIEYAGRWRQGEPVQ